MTFIIIIFLITTIGAFSMLLHRAWEIKTSRIIFKNEESQKYPSRISFRYIEKILLYIIKYAIQWIVLSSVKLWYILRSKIKTFIQNKLPKINKLFIKKSINGTDTRKISFIEKAVIESKINIKKVKEKIINDEEDEEENEL